MGIMQATLKSEMNDLKSLPLTELIARPGSSPDGLSQAEAQRGLVQYGYNEMAAPIRSSSS